MADEIFESRLWLARPRPEVFALVADPAHLSRVSPPGLGLRVLGAPGPLAAGAVVELRLRYLGVPLRWRSFIREWDPPFRFVDVQVEGPWARWEHRHRFLAADGATCIEDRVTYRPPLGLLGQAVHRALVRRRLRALWAYRDRRLTELLGPLAPPPAG